MCARAEMSIKDRFKGTQLTGLRVLKLITMPGLVLKNEELGIPLSLVIVTSLSVKLTLECNPKCLSLIHLHVLFLKLKTSSLAWDRR